MKKLGSFSKVAAALVFFVFSITTIHAQQFESVKLDGGEMLAKRLTKSLSLSTEQAAEVKKQWKASLLGDIQKKDVPNLTQEDKRQRRLARFERFVAQMDPYLDEAQMALLKKRLPSN